MVTGPRPTVRRAGAAPRPLTSVRRLLLDAAEWALLGEDRLPTAPPGFSPGPLDDADRARAIAGLTRSGVLRPQGEQPVPAVAAQLAVLRRPLLTLRLDVDGRDGGLRGWFAVGDEVLVGVLTRPAGGVELSLSPAVRLGEELTRAVPDVTAVTGSAAVPSAGRAPLPLTGRLPLALLQDPAAPSPDAGSTALAAELAERTAGSLSCLVLGPAGDQQLGAGQVSWLATDAGWLGLRPVLDGSPERWVDLVPVTPPDLGAWVAPTVAALLEATDEQS